VKQNLKIDLKTPSHVSTSRFYISKCFQKRTWYMYWMSDLFLSITKYRRFQWVASKNNGTMWRCPYEQNVQCQCCSSNDDPRGITVWTVHKVRTCNQHIVYIAEVNMISYFILTFKVIYMYW